MVGAGGNANGWKLPSQEVFRLVGSQDEANSYGIGEISLFFQPTALTAARLSNPFVEIGQNNLSRIHEGRGTRVMRNLQARARKGVSN
mmetsp:Transcript_7588/g.15046  ORF Transcript_7588/g.15046 Transcript_7588/m.15046 type:complete len:88 (+) Transcript_7588:331-594(+)